MRVRVVGAEHAKMSGQHVAVLVSAAVWSKRRRDLASSRTQAVCRMHAVRCELVPGGVPERIIAARAAPTAPGCGLVPAVQPGGVLAVCR
jgi:hypothetical protein